MKVAITIDYLASYASVWD